MKKFLSIILAVVMIATALPLAYAESTQTFILFTNDIHCNIEGYPYIAALRAEAESMGTNVVVVDAGDAIQGEVIGSLTEGEAVVDLMNAAGYDYAVPGNHEFDYGVDRLKDLAENKAEYTYLSSNFYYLPKAESVFAPYAIEDFGSYQIAFVGISTPDTITSSTPEYFKDENGNYIYAFPVFPGGMTDEDLYENVQESVDSAIAEGADIVVAVGHLGILGSTDGWKSTDVIANTDGIDYFIDGHSHETIEGAVYKNKNNEDVVLASTGEKFNNVGGLIISSEFSGTSVISLDMFEGAEMSPAAKAAYDSVAQKVEKYKNDVAYLSEEIGTSEAKLVIYDDDGTRIVRNQETNAGDFVADAYRAVTGADVAIVNGGGIRAEVEAGAVSRKDLMDVNSFNNEMCVLEVTGQQLIDVLEHGARRCPELLGSFFQVSGVTFEIHTYRESPVICDQLDNFIGIDGSKERRVQNVLVGGKPVDLGKTYTLAGSQYVLTQGGDGLTMLEGSPVVQQDGLPCDSEMLIKYFTEYLGGKITADQYGNPEGDGRITIISENPDAPVCDYEIHYGETLTVTVKPTDDEDPTIVKFVPEDSAKFALYSEAEEADAYCTLYDSVLEFAGYSDDTSEGLNFRLEYEFEAGKTYYFEVGTYSDSTETFDITLGCGHNFENGVCAFCGEECDHSEIGNLGYCYCGDYFLGKDINEGDEIEYIAADHKDSMWLRFASDEGGIYIIDSVSEEEGDPECMLYDESGEIIESAYDENGMDFAMIVSLEAGETYYFEIYNCNEATVSVINFRRAVHTADDGSGHTDVEYVEETYSNCTEHGYTEGLYCNECEEYFYGHEELELDENYHADDNDDGFCDLCGKEIIYGYGCDCICHSDNWFFNMIWRVANFFHRIFRVLPLCECGDLHY